MELVYMDGPSPVSNKDIPQDLESAILYKIDEIKREAERRITALDWRLQRAQERELLGESGVEALQDVLLLREQIRQASNSAETVLDSLVNLDDILSFSW